MLFSIIIPTFNYGRYIARALQSVLAQPLNDYEIIIVDDGSTDNTLEILQPYLSKYRHIQFLTQQNQGPGKARNRAANNAIGEWLIFLDADDYLHDNAFAIFTQAMQQHPHASVIMAGHSKQYEDQQPKKGCSPVLSINREKNVVDFILEKLRWQPGSFTVKREVFLSLGGYAESVYHREDKVLWGRLIANADVVAVSDPVVCVCAHPGRLRDDHQSRHKEALQYIEILFDPTYMPPAFQQLKALAYAREYLSLLKSYYHQKDYHKAINAFHQVVKLFPSTLLRLQALKYYLLACLRKISV
jgi:glycosyltransferase involved in cell wall biosynthesis